MGLVGVGLVFGFDMVLKCVIIDGWIEGLCIIVCSCDLMVLVLFECCNFEVVMRFFVDFMFIVDMVVEMVECMIIEID